MMLYIYLTQLFDFTDYQSKNILMTISLYSYNNISPAEGTPWRKGLEVSVLKYLYVPT